MERNSGENESMNTRLEVSDVMSKRIFSVSGDIGLKDAAKTLLEKNISSLAVTDSGKIVGIVTQTESVPPQSAAILRWPTGDIYTVLLLPLSGRHMACLSGTL